MFLKRSPGKGLLPVRCQANTPTNADLLQIVTLLGISLGLNSNYIMDIFFQENASKNVHILAILFRPCGVKSFLLEPFDIISYCCSWFCITEAFNVTVMFTYLFWSTVIFPLLTYWSYVFLALNHRCVLLVFQYPSRPATRSSDNSWPCLSALHCDPESHGSHAGLNLPPSTSSQTDPRCHHHWQVGRKSKD